MRTSRTQLEATVKRQRRYRSLLKIRREREWIGKASRGKRGRLENIRMMRKEPARKWVKRSSSILRVTTDLPLSLFLY